MDALKPQQRLQEVSLPTRRNGCNDFPLNNAAGSRVIAVPTGSPPAVRIVDGLTLASLDAFFAFGSPLGAAFVAGSA